MIIYDQKRSLNESVERPSADMGLFLMYSSSAFRSSASSSSKTDGLQRSLKGYSELLAKCSISRINAFSRASELWMGAGRTATNVH